MRLAPAGRSSGLSIIVLIACGGGGCSGGPLLVHDDAGIEAAAPDAIGNDGPVDAVPVDDVIGGDVLRDAAADDAIDSGLPVVHVTSPAAGPTYANATVHVTVTVDPDLDLPVVLKNDGATLATLAAPVRSFDWDTTSTTEGPHTILAEVASSGTTVASAPVTVVVDRTSPAVTSQVPAPGAVDVLFRSPIRITFSEPIVLPPSGQPTFALSIAGVGVATTAALDADSRGATIAIDDPTTVVLPATFSLSIPSSITDLAGNPIPGSGAWSWSAPDWFKVRGAAGDQLVIDSDFRLVTLSQPASGIRVIVLDPGGGEPTYLPDIPDLLPGAATGAPFALAIDGQNHPVVAWPEAAVLTAGAQISFATWDGSSWDRTTPSIAVATATTPRFSVLLRLDGTGRLVVAWADGTGAWDFARSTGSDWERPFGPIAAIPEQGVDVALTRNGDPVLAWVELGDIGHVSIWNGADWTAAPTLPQAESLSAVGLHPRFLALDALDAPMLFASGAVHHLFGGAWQPVTVPIPTDPSGTHFRLTVDSDHLPVVFWNQAIWRISILKLARWTGTKWDVSPELSGGTGLVTVDRRDNVWIGFDGNVWMSNR